MQIFKLFILGALSAAIFNACSINGEKETRFYGNVDVRTVSLAFRVSGRLDQINFDEGEKVKKGDVIARLDDDIYKENLNQIEASIAMQKAKVAKLEKGYRVEEIKKGEAKLLQSGVERDRLKKEFNRVSKLFKENSISEQEYDNAKAAYEQAGAQYLYAQSSLEILKNGYEKEDILSAKAALASLEAQKNLHKINLEDTVLYAPNDGTIITRAYEKGSIVSPSQPVVELAKDDEYWVRSYMNEKYLGIIKTGLKAAIHTDSGNRYKGVVSFISPIAEFTPKTVQTEDLRTDLVYRFRIVLKDFDDGVKQGMPVTITFENINFDK